MSLGDNIRRKREEYGLRQDELAERAKINNVLICYYEAGTRVPTVANLSAIADALHCSTDELLGRINK